MTGTTIAAVVKRWCLILNCYPCLISAWSGVAHMGQTVSSRLVVAGLHLFFEVLETELFTCGSCVKIGVMKEWHVVDGFDYVFGFVFRA